MAVPLLLLCALIASVLFYTSQNEHAVKNNLYRTLGEAALQQRTLLNTKIDSQFSQLEILADFISTEGAVVNDRTLSSMNRAAEECGFFNIGLIDIESGAGKFNDGSSFDVSAEKFFSQAVAGNRGIQYAKLNAEDGKGAIVFTVPVYENGEVVAVLCANYDSDEFSQLMETTALNNESYSYVTDGVGDIIIPSNHESALLQDGNVLDFIADTTLERGITMDTVRSYFENGESYSFAISSGDEMRLVLLADAGINDWRLIFVATSAVVAQETLTSATMTFTFTLMLMLIFAAFTLTIWVYGKRSQRIIAFQEEEYRVAASHSDKIIMRYDVKGKTASFASENAPDSSIKRAVTDRVPESVVEAGLIAKESVQDYLNFFGAIQKGEPTGAQVIHMRLNSEQFAWFRAEYTLIGNEKTVCYAIISFTNVTRQREQEIVYENWRRSMDALPEDGYRLVECNLTLDMLEHEEGSFMDWLSENRPVGFNARTVEDTHLFVHEEDQEQYTSILNRESLLSQYYQGKYEVNAELRMRDGMDVFRWIEISVQMVPYPDSEDVKAFVLYKDIDARKCSELELKERSETDLMTGIYNRAAFVEQADRLVAQSDWETRHAFLFLDIDLFKQVNDTLGHAAGDRALIELSSSLRSVLRRNDLIGRMGGDEFMICLENITYDAVIEKRARELCELARIKLNNGVSDSISIGIAVFPTDGTSFEELYKKADIALYHTKENGGNGYSFYRDDMDGTVSDANLTGITAPQDGLRLPNQDRTMLIADDSELNRTILASIFKDDYHILTAADGAQTLRIMRKFGTGISILLLDIFMPRVDGMEVLRKMREEPALSAIPVVVVSGSSEAETALKAIELGASDYVSKPVEPRLVKIRVQSAIAKAENNLIRAQRSYALLESTEEARYRHILSSTGTAIVEFDPLNNVFMYDELLHQMLAGTFDKRGLWEILVEDGVAEAMDVDAMRAICESIAAFPKSSGEEITVLLQTRCGERRWFRMSVCRLNYEELDTGRVLITFNDVNEDHLKNERLRQMAERDTLTGVYNRAAFVEKTAQLLLNSQDDEYAIAQADIERFKVINELYGHAEGDKLLRFVGETMQNFVGNEGICCRLSADTFAACVRRSEGLSQRFQESVEKVFSMYELPVELTMSFGICVVDDTTLPIDTLLDRASMALKTVKGSYVKHVAYYDDALRLAMLEEQEVIGRADFALEHEEFVIYLHPQYDHLTGALVGAEALVRWLHPDKGLISPSQFIPVFERNGFITKLDHFVWDKTCRLLRRRLDEGRKVLPISVNISRIDLYDPTLCDRIMALIEKYGLDPGLLRLEITESAYVDNPRQLIDVVRELQQRGFIIEMDDFGSGYSSLNTLKDVPVDVLKMDMKFLSSKDADPRTNCILQSIINMASRINLPVIAEGVESKEQADYLLSLGCNLVQGYFYAKPMPESEFERLLEQESTPRK